MEQDFRRLGLRRLGMMWLLLVALMISLLLDLQAGPANLSIAQIVQGLWEPQSLELRYRTILLDVRLPDALIALAVGAALGLSGIETQTVLNNPLASPYTLGVSAFAAFGASIAIVFMPVGTGLLQTFMLPLMALLLALLCGGLVLLFSRFMAGARESVVLFGMALFFLGEALTSAMQYVAPSEAIDQIVFWTIGDLTKAGWLEVGIVTLCFVLVFPFSMRHVWVMTLLRAGEDQVRSLGLDMNRIRLWVLLRVSILCAFAVCFVGAIGFVGLIGPHIARMLLGEDHRYLVPGAALCGALILSLASFLSKALLEGVVIPVGIITSLVGVPIFLALIIMQGRRT